MSTGHNYVKKLREMQRRGELKAGLNEVEIIHDDWCALLVHDGFCDCDPVIRKRQTAKPSGAQEQATHPKQL